MRFMRPGPDFRVAPMFPSRLFLAAAADPEGAAQLARRLTRDLDLVTSIGANFGLDSADVATRFCACQVCLRRARRFAVPSGSAARAGAAPTTKPRTQRRARDIAREGRRVPRG
jgi:hypothetical protein